MGIAQPSQPTSLQATVGLATTARRTMSVLVAATSALGLLAGCSGDGVATIDKNKPGKSDTSDQAKAAANFQTCMDKAGVKSDLQTQDDGTAIVNFLFEGGMYMCRPDGMCGGGMSGDGSDAEYKAHQKVVEKYSDGQHEGEAILVLGTEDHSEAYGKCLKETGYVEPEYKSDPAQELKSKQAQAKAGAEWAECLRNNGFPSVKDPQAAKADNYQTVPTVLLPTDLTEAQARQMLVVCPLFDKEARLKAMKEATDDPKSDGVPMELMTDPAFGFDLPGFDGQQGSASDQGEPSEAESTRLNKLMEILFEPINAFYAELSKQMG